MNETDFQKALLHLNVQRNLDDNEQMKRKINLNENKIECILLQITNCDWNLKKIQFYDAIRNGSNNTLYIKPLLQLMVQYLMEYRFTIVFSDDNNDIVYLAFSEINHSPFNTKLTNICGIKNASWGHHGFRATYGGYVTFTVSIDDVQNFALINGQKFTKMDNTYFHPEFGSLTITKNSHDNGISYDIFFRLINNYLE